MKKTLSLCLPVTLMLAPGVSSASSIYIGYAQSEQPLYLGDSTYSLSAKGPSLLWSYDLDENWTINADLAKQQVHKQVAPQTNADYESDSWGIGTSYYATNWSAYYQYSVFEDEQFIDDLGPPPSSLSSTDADTHSLGFSYYWLLSENWQLGSGLGLHYNDWQQHSTELPDEPDRAPITTLAPGNATLLSISGNINRLIRVSEQTELSLGFYLSWNEVLDEHSEDGEIINREPNRLNPPERDNNRGNVVASGSESYGLLNIYLSLEFNEQWIIDMDGSVDFGNGDSEHAWSVNLGYRF